LTELVRNEPSASEGLIVTIVAPDVGGIGGMELQLERLVTGLIDKGATVIVVARNCRLTASPFLHWVRVPGPSRPFPIAYLSFLVLGTLMLARGRRGLVHAIGANVLNRVDVCTVHHCHHAAAAKARVFSRSRPHWIYWLNAQISEPLKRFGETVCYRPSRVNRIVVASPGVLEEVCRYFPRLCGRCSIVPNGVDIDAYSYSPERRSAARAALSLAPDDPVALFVGGDWERKGLRSAIQAVGLTQVFRLVVVGKGDGGWYGQIAAQAGISDRVVFSGVVDTPIPFFLAADVFLLPTSYETFSLAAHEAAAASLPLLVGRVNGVEEILADGVNGWFITQDPAQIADRLSRLLQPEVRRLMGNRSRAAVHRFSWTAMVEGYEALYSELRRESSLLPG
jgi:glycosyltransferase involved in cell wall biosynthesis